MRLARNGLIVALLAFGVAFLPSGGALADAVLTAITLAFLGVLTWTVFRLAGAQAWLLNSLSGVRRALLFGGAGLVVLMVAGAGNLLHSGSGTVIWLALSGSGVAIIWLVLAEARGS